MGTADHPASVLESLADVVSLGVLEGNCSQGFRFGGTLQAGESWMQDYPEVRITLRSMKFWSSRMFPASNDSRKPPLRRREPYRSACPSVSRCSHEVHHQQRDVLETISRWWDEDGEHVEPVIKIAAKAFFGN